MDKEHKKELWEEDLYTMGATQAILDYLPKLKQEWESDSFNRGTKLGHRCAACDISTGEYPETPEGLELKNAVLEEITQARKEERKRITKKVVEMERDIVNQSNQAGYALSMSHGYNMALAEVFAFLTNPPREE